MNEEQYCGCPLCDFHRALHRIEEQRENFRNALFGLRHCTKLKDAKEVAATVLERNA